MKSFTQHEHTNTHAKRPYQAPELQVVMMRPEEQLLACLKLNQGATGSCWGGTRTPNKS